MTLFQPYTEAEDIKRVAALRRSLLSSGMGPHGLRATLSDLAKFDLVAWEGTFLGVVCVEGPITVVPR